MARIDEERILIRVSLLIRDDSNVNVTTLLDPTTIVSTEQYVNSLVQNLGDGIIVEATNITGSTIIFPSTYSITESDTTVMEGNSLTFTVTTTNVISGTTLYWTNAGSSTATDFTSNINSGTVFINNDSGIISLVPRNESNVEGPETIVIQIRTDGLTGPIVTTSNTVTVFDAL